MSSPSAEAADAVVPAWRRRAAFVGAALGPERINARARAAFSQSARLEWTPPRARSQCSLYFISQLCFLCRSPPRCAPRSCRLRVRCAADRYAPQLIIIYYFSERQALAFPLQGTANPDGPGTTGLGGCSSPIPGVARPPSIISHSILGTPFARSSRPSSATEQVVG
ncbi:hypothetical protein EVAR_60659_1 [Eumeta japonica]|uniref:Uncharacterized protein n=1 Tax=Eumeta variegata TaxID=151549 RepID=A0A4C1ZND4_EUMVA|nr:hypothetical protein EVAR_60659_1 [Eumeta japonica]